MSRNLLENRLPTPNLINDYFSLTKPRLALGNLLAAAAGFFLGTALPVDWFLFMSMLAGLFLVIGSGCALNNYFDTDIDARMERTRERALPAGRIPTWHALFFGLILLIAGSALLGLYANILALGSALVGFVFYVFLYTPLKHKTPHALWVGAVAGAMPPVVGYAAAAGALDAYAAALFAALFAWQIPHFFAIAIYRFEEYSTAGIPLFIRKPPTEKQRHVARKIFHYSLLVLLAGCVMIPLLRFAL